MKKRVLNKENLDKIGANLLKASQMTDAEIENIVNRPQLFDSVISRIKSEETNQRPKRLNKHNLRLSFGIAATAAIVLMIAAIAFYNRSDNSTEIRLAQNESRSETAIPIVSSEKVLMPSTETETKPVIKTTAQVIQSARQKIRSNSQRKSTKVLSNRQSSTVSDSIPVEENFADEGKFYVLPFADNSADDNITQIIRAELSRAELSALGIDLPLAESDNERILTDLVYGATERPQAFRIVAVF